MHAGDNLRIEISMLDDLCVVTLRGEWDISEKINLREAFLSVGSRHDVLVDLREADFFDSSALGELVSAHHRITAAGRRFDALVGRSNMRRLLELTGLEELLGITPEREAQYEARLPRASQGR